MTNQHSSRQHGARRYRAVETGCPGAPPTCNRAQIGYLVRHGRRRQRAAVFSQNRSSPSASGFQFIEAGADLSQRPTEHEAGTQPTRRATFAPMRAHRCPRR